MNKDDLRSLRIQILLIVGMFMGCAVVAGFIATQRSWFESHFKEEYAALPAELEPLAAKAAGEELVEEDLDGLSPEVRLRLYDAWMSAERPAPGTPRALVAADSSLFLGRAERTIVCGNGLQRRRALEFLELCASRDVIPLLEKARGWSARRSMISLRDDIDVVLQEVRSKRSGDAPARAY